MSWIRSGLPSISISDWLGVGTVVASGPANGLEDARDALLDALGDAGGPRRESLLRRIASAPDVHALWAMRPDVMNAVAQSYGESEGRRRLAQASGKFEGLVPAAALTSGRRRHGMAPAWR